MDVLICLNAHGCIFGIAPSGRGFRELENIMTGKLKAALAGFVIAAAFVGGTEASLADSEFNYFDFKCPSIGVERTKDSLVAMIKQGGEALVVKYACDGRSCFNLQRPSESKSGELRVRHIYFPRGRTEFIYSIAVWLGENDAPMVMESRVVPLVGCQQN